QIVNTKTGEIVGDSGYVQNVITAAGKQDYIVGALGALAGSKPLLRLALSTQTLDPVSSDTSFTANSEFGGRKALTASFSSPGTLVMTASWAGADLGAQAPKTIRCIGVFNTTNTDATFAGAATYATSQWSSDQAVNATYSWQFS